MVLFVLLTFAVSWVLWVPDTVAARRTATVPDQLATALGAGGPLVAAVLCIAFYEGRPGFRDLAQRFLTWRVPLRWYAVVLLGPAALSIVATGAGIAFGGDVPNFADPPILTAYPLPEGAEGSVPWLALLPAVMLQQLVAGSALGEEPGWRGYALPRLQHDYSSLTASLMLGTIWGVWHLPLWLRPDQPVALQVEWELPRIIAIAVLITWVFNHTSGSLLLAMLLHASIAVTGLFLSSSDVPAIGAVLTCLLAAVVVASCGPRRLCRQPADEERQRQAPPGDPGRAEKR
jgi:membrane protease YdiL (CAAX protease family)